MTEFEKACSYIDGIPKFAPGTGLEHTQILLSSLGNPEKKYKSVHIAGTNGKGSVAKMTALMLEEAGFRVGLFISPHLIRMNERISINGVEITDEEFAAEFETVLGCVEKLSEPKAGVEKLTEAKDSADYSVEVAESEFVHPSYFEFLFAMAADFFAKKVCDYVVFETGLGGRLDATNVITPVVSVITSVGFDHMQVLGNTIEEIAGEKAGIIKPGVPMVFNTGSEDADRVILRTAEKKGSRAIDAVKAFEELPDALKEAVEDFAVAQPAVYQSDNATTAVVASYEILGIGERFVRPALERFYWPGRMEFLADGIVIDGAHNEDAAKQFVKSLRELMKNGGNGGVKNNGESSEKSDKNSSEKKGGWKKLSLLFAVCADKDYEDIIRILCEGLDLEDVYVAELASGRKASAQIVGSLFQNYRPAGEYWDTYYFNNVESAWKLAVSERTEDTLLAVVGSLYLVGEIKALISGQS